MKRTIRVRFGAMALYVSVVGCPLFLAPVPTAAQEQRADTASVERTTPIDAWVARPRKIELSPEQLKRVDGLKTEYLAEFDKLGGDNQMAVVMQALELELKYRKLVRSLLTPEQQTVFDENVRKGGLRDRAFEPARRKRGEALRTEVPGNPSSKFHADLRLVEQVKIVEFAEVPLS